MLISSAEYARRHGKSDTVVRNHCRAGKFKTAVKSGGTWLIDDHEPYPEGARGRKSSAARAAEMQRERERTQTLMDITGHESGVFIYDYKIIICNVSGFLEPSVPLLSPFGDIWSQRVDYLRVVDEHSFSDPRDELPDNPNVLYDRWGDYETLEVNSGKAYTIVFSVGGDDRELKAVVPDDWA